MISPIAQSQQASVFDLVMPALGAVLICFFTERHSLLTQVAFMSFTRHCFFRSQVYRGLSGRHCLGTPPRSASRLPHVLRRRAAFRRPERRRGGLRGQRAGEQVPVFVEAGGRGATCHIGGDDNELLSQKGAPLPPPLRCRFLHVVYVSRAADDADVAAAPAPPTAARAAAAAGSATHAAARCNRPKKTGKKFRKTKTAARAKNRVAAQTAATVALLSEPRVGPAPPSVHAVIARAHGRCKAHGVQKHKRHACILGSKGGIGSKVQNQPLVIRTATEPIDYDWKIV